MTATKDRLKILYSSASEEWYTPRDLIATAAHILGGIDLDPAADQDRRVPAKKHYTIEDDGLRQSWCASSCFLNPPYNRTIGKWIRKGVGEYTLGNTKQLLFLVPARVDTKWWQHVKIFSVSFLIGRVKFDSPHPGPAPAMPLGPAMSHSVGPSPAIMEQYKEDLAAWANKLAVHNKPVSATFPSALVYLGPDPEFFHSCTQELGSNYRPWPDAWHVSRTK